MNKFFDGYATYNPLEIPPLTPEEVVRVEAKNAKRKNNAVYNAYARIWNLANVNPHTSAKEREILAKAAKLLEEII